MEQPLLEVQHLKKYFPTGAGLLHAVDDVSFTLEQGKTLGVVGESGCGKSTLGRVLLHLLESTDGKILFEGKDITRVDRAELSRLRRNMQIIFQDPFSSLNPRMTISQTIAEPLMIEGGLNRQQIQDKVYELMDLVGLARRLVNTYPHELDGGRRQRVGIARALALNPKFIVCDEPVSALDVSIQAQVLNLLLDLQEQMGLTYIFITHDLSVVKYISDTIMVMYLDEIVELMVETVCAKRKTTRIAGSDFPHEVVRSRFLKLDCSHIEFVMECLRNNTTEIRNMKQYLLAVLFNAPTTISNHYTAQVNHDMYAGGW